VRRLDFPRAGASNVREARNQQSGFTKGHDMKEPNQTAEISADDWIMVCIEKPFVESIWPATDKWASLKIKLEQIPNLKESAEKLCDNVWLFRSDDTGKQFARVISDFCAKPGGVSLVCETYTIPAKPEKWK